MKRITAILFIAAFVIQCSGQLWIWLAFKINQDYIATNLCINRFDLIPVCKGSCVLEDRLNQHQQTQEKQPELKPVEPAVFTYRPGWAILTPPVILVPETIYFIAEEVLYSSGYSSPVFHPPGTGC